MTSSWTGLNSAKYITKLYDMTDIHNLENWLNKNVLKVSKPNKLVLHSFKVDLRAFSGSFMVDVDEEALNASFSLYLGSDGKVHFGEPMFHSPMGVPASYAAIEIDSDTRLAIANSICNLFPKFRSYCFHKDLNRMIDSSSSLEDRVIDIDSLKSFESKLLDPNFKLTVVG
jgi:hypothetical protein